MLCASPMVAELTFQDFGGVVLTDKEGERLAAALGKLLTLM